MANTVETKAQGPLQNRPSIEPAPKVSPELRLAMYNIALERLKEQYRGKEGDVEYPSPQEAIQEAGILLAFVEGERTGDSFLDGVLIHEDGDGWVHIKDGTAPASFLFDGMTLTQPSWLSYLWSNWSN